MFRKGCETELIFYFGNSPDSISSCISERENVNYYLDSFGIGAIKGKEVFVNQICLYRLESGLSQLERQDRKRQ